MRGRHRSRTAIYLLQGLAVCGRCGSPVLTRSATPQRRGLVSPAAYVCRARKLARHELPRRCDAPIVPVAEIDARVWRAVSSELATPALLARLAERHRDGEADAEGWRADAEAAERHLARLERVEQAILQRFRRGTIGEGALDLELEALRRERAGAAAQRDRALDAGRRHDTGRQRLRDAQTLVRELAAATAAATPAERRAIMLALVPAGGATLHPWGELEVSVFVPTTSTDVRPLRAGCSSATLEHLQIRVVA